jgi:hypothetical protein
VCKGMRSCFCGVGFGADVILGSLAKGLGFLRLLQLVPRYLYCSTPLLQRVSSSKVTKQQ